MKYQKKSICVNIDKKLVIKKCMLFLFLSLCLMSLINCSKNQSVVNKEDILGSWESFFPADEEANESDKFVFQLTESKEGGVTGVIHTYQNNTKVMGAPLKKITYKNPDLQIIIKTGVKIIYEGKLSADKQEIVGKLLYPDGTSMEMNLNKTIDKENQARPLAKGEKFEYSYQVPEETDDGWTVSPLDMENVRTELISEMVEKIVAEEYGFIHSVLIVKNDKLILEEYFYGHDKNTPHLISSNTKSITSLLLGIAIDKNFIKSVDENLFTFFPQYVSLKTEESGKVTLKHLLTMSSGFQLHETDLYKCEDRMKCDLGREIIYQPGSEFQYDNSSANLLAGVLKYATDSHADQFAEKYLFAPLGITNYDWEDEKQNDYPLCQGSLKLLPRDMAKIGSLVLNKGKWQNKQIISEKWINESTKPYFSPKNFPEYGYMWSLVESTIDDIKIKAIVATGIGSQFIYIAPELNTVVVITGGNFHNNKTIAPVKMVEDYILKEIL